MNADGCATGFRCVQCGFPIGTLYIQYSPGNIRLMNCEYCKAVADEYIECEVMILIIDLILHKPKAYRHLFYNRFSKATVNFEGLLWKSILAFLILDIYRMWALRMNENEWTLPVTVVSFLLDFGQVFISAVLENLVFLAVMIHGTGKLLSASARAFGWKEVLLVVIISSYFRIFLMAMMDLSSNAKPHKYVDAIESYGNKMLQFGFSPQIMGETNRLPAFSTVDCGSKLKTLLVFGLMGLRFRAQAEKCCSLQVLLPT